MSLGFISRWSTVPRLSGTLILIAGGLLFLRVTRRPLTAAWSRPFSRLAPTHPYFVLSFVRSAPISLRIAPFTIWRLTVGSFPVSPVMWLVTWPTTRPISRFTVRSAVRLSMRPIVWFIMWCVRWLAAIAKRHLLRFLGQLFRCSITRSITRFAMRWMLLFRQCPTFTRFGRIIWRLAIRSLSSFLGPFVFRILVRFAARFSTSGFVRSFTRRLAMRSFVRCIAGVSVIGRVRIPTAGEFIRRWSSVLLLVFFLRRPFLSTPRNKYTNNVHQCTFSSSPSWAWWAQIPSLARPSFSASL